MNAAVQDVDIIIAGGGTVGSALALALINHTQFSVAIVEAHAFESGQPHPGFDARSVALAQQSVHILNGFGLNDQQLGCDIKHIHVSDQGYLGQCRLHAQDYHLEQLGRVVELQYLGEQLHQGLSAAKSEKLHWFCPDKVATINQQQDQVEVTTSQGKTIVGKLLVVAEGGNSPTRQMLNIHAQVSPYDQVALIANIGLDRHHEHWAYERFTANGPLALLPLNEQDGMSRSSLVWTLSDGQHQELLDMDEGRFLAKLQEAFGHRLGRFVKVGERLCYPLSLVRAENLVSHRAALMGNASQSLHPIAGQGLNLALRDVQGMLELLKNAETEGRDPGEFSLLNRYQNQRRPDQDTVVGLTDSLVRLFSNRHLPLVVGRNLGLTALELMPSMKGTLARQAMGLTEQGATDAIL